MEQTVKPRIAGYLLVITGSIAILGMLLMTFILWALAQGMAVGYAEPGNAPLALILIMGLLFTIPGIIAVLGGVNALRRRRWGLALAGAIGACFYFNVLGIPALVLVLLGKNEFSGVKARV